MEACLEHVKGKTLPLLWRCGKVHGCLVLDVKSGNCQLHRSYIKRRAQMHCVDMSARYSYMYKSHMSLQLMLVQFLQHFERNWNELSISTHAATCTSF